ncbi:MAG: short chain dehydrogenase family protein [Hyphomicrobiales bacterium]|nr:short chain dehydrogenase family protein [Hyphomicrobiales bacterium]
MTNSAAPILIYGATGGVGEASARALVQAGAQVHLVARRSDALETLASELGATFTCIDFDAPDAFKQASQEASADGVIAGLVFAVGTINIKPVSRLTRVDFERDFLVNAIWAAEAVQAALPFMIKYSPGARPCLHWDGKGGGRSIDAFARRRTRA